MSRNPSQQAEAPTRAVTSSGRRVGASAAERKRQQRQRERQLIYETEDWRLFVDLVTLPQKAGCHPTYLGAIVLKELVDNALDTGANVSLDCVDGTWIVSDDGPGLDPADVPRLFAVNRPLLSSKLKRLPLRGMLGNGLRVVVGAVAAMGGGLIVETRGHRLTLAICPQTGRTIVVADELVIPKPGVTVHLSIRPHDPTDDCLARGTIAAARSGVAYRGASSPWWYGARDLERLCTQVTPSDTTVGALCRNLGFYVDDPRLARALVRTEIEALLSRLRLNVKPVPPENLGFIGREFQQDWPGYARKAGTTITAAGAHIPYVVEAWAGCEVPQKKGQGEVEITTLINRSMTVATVHAACGPGIITIQGCGLRRQVKGPGTGNYQVFLSVIAPHVQLATDGKEPSLAPFSEAIAEVLRKACGAAHRAMQRPYRGVSIKDAAWSLMEDAYRKASGEGRYPANARQVMYAARPEILRLTGKDKLDDAYFTQVLLPD
jgi:Histidine kinase-, DNA gyrase B-, and HSP90-like ATPase